MSSTAPGTDYWDEIVAGICAIEPESDWVPGERAGYHLQCGMIVLAEVVRRIDGRRFETYVRDEVFEPLGMTDCWVGMPADVAEGYGERIGTMHSTPRGSRSRSTCSTPPTPWPGAPRVAVAGDRCASSAGSTRRCWLAVSSTTTACCCRRRSRRSPRTTASASTTRRSTRCATGASASPSTRTRWVGTRRLARSDTAARSSAISFADPEHGLVAVVQTNGMCGNDDHYLRLDAVTTALYEDLGLVRSGSPGRDKPFPSVELTAATD